MNRRIAGQLLIVGACFFFVSMAPGSLAQKGSVDKPQILYIGRITEDPHDTYTKFRQMADYLEQALVNQGVSAVRVRMARDRSHMIELFNQGKIDLASVNPFSALTIMRETNTEIFLEKVREPEPYTYSSLFFTHKNSSIKKLSDLRGKVVSFQKLASLSAYAIPAAELLANGLELARLDSPLQAFDKNKVGYVFSSTERISALWIDMKLVDAAVMNNVDWANDSKMPDHIVKDIAIFHETRKYPKSVELIRSDLDPDFKSFLKSIMVNMHLDNAAKTALKNYQETKKFKAIDGQNESSLEYLDSLVEFFEEYDTAIHNEASE